MRKGTLGVLAALVLALTLALLLAAGPAAAVDYPEVYTPSTAYVHPYDGPEIGYWEECAADGTYAIWDIDHTPNPWDPAPPYKAIPAGYKVYFAAIFQAMPRGQMVAMPSKFLFDFTIGSTRVGERMAARYWLPTQLLPDWVMPVFHRGEMATAVRSWLYPVTVTPGTTYTGTMAYRAIAPMIDLIVWDPAMTRPSHIPTYSSSAPYSFTVAH